MKKEELGGSTYIVLVDGEYAGWFNIAGSSTDILRAALSSNPQVLDMEDIPLDIDELPRPATGYFWDGKNFIKKEENGN